MTENTTKQTKSYKAALWVMYIHHVTGGVWLTPAQIMQHYPGGRISKMTANRAIAAALAAKDGTNCTKQ